MGVVSIHSCIEAGEIAEVEEAGGQDECESAQAKFQVIGLQPFPDPLSMQPGPVCYEAQAAGDEHREGRNREQKKAGIFEKQAEQSG